MLDARRLFEPERPDFRFAEAAFPPPRGFLPRVLDCPGGSVNLGSMRLFKGFLASAFIQYGFQAKLPIFGCSQLFKSPATRFMQVNSSRCNLRSGKHPC